MSIAKHLNTLAKLNLLFDTETNQAILNTRDIDLYRLNEIIQVELMQAHFEGRKDILNRVKRELLELIDRLENVDFGIIINSNTVIALDDVKKAISDVTHYAEKLISFIDEKLQQSIEAPANPYPEVFKPGGYDLFIYLYDEDTTFKPKTRVSVLYHGLRNDIFTSTVTHELFKEFLEKEFRLTTSKITKPNYRGQDYIKDTLPQMVERYKKLHQ